MNFKQVCGLKDTLRDFSVDSQMPLQLILGVNLLLMSNIKLLWSSWGAGEMSTEANWALSFFCLFLLPELSCSASVYPQTSPLVNRLSLSPLSLSVFISPCLHLSVFRPVSLHLRLCSVLVTGEKRGREMGEKERVYVQV